MAAADKCNTNFGLPNLNTLSEAERLQVLAVMQRAKEFEMNEEAKSKSRRPLEGQLTKFTNVMKGWQPRWFILDPESGMFEYFEKEEHKKHRPRGSVHLGAAVISPSDEDSQTFTVSAANGEVYKLRAMDAKERQQWVDRVRVTAQYHTANMAQNTALASRPEVRSASINNSASTGSLAILSKTARKPHTSSTENINTSLPPQPSRPPVPSGPSGGSSRAPAAHPHTIDPFREVKEYLREAEDYAQHFTDRCNNLPQTGEPINGLDREILLMKATSSATLECLGQCLTMLQQRQESFGVVLGGPVGASNEVRSPGHTKHSFSGSITDGKISPSGSFSSVNSLTYSLPAVSKPTPSVINHEEEMEDEAEYKDTDLEGVEEHKSIILHLLSQLKLGMDLTKVVLPTFILERRSLLEMFADCMAHPDIFLRITELEHPEDRMLGILEWYLTSFHAGRQGSVAKKPYNPIIGETFHCSWKFSPERHGNPSDGSTDDYYMSYCAEQVSHHPPVSAFYFECPKKNVCINASIWTKSKFMGMSIGVVMVGKISVKLLDFDEEYVFTLPSAYCRSILTTPWVELGDKIQMTCQKTNYSAAIVFHTKPFYGGKLHRVSAELKNGATGNSICRVQGEWNKELEFIYNEKDTKVVDVNQLSIWRKRVRSLKQQGDFESRKLWEHVTNALKVGDVSTATEHKSFLEERQREGERHRKDTDTPFPTKFFRKEDDTWIYKDMLTKDN